MIISACEQQRPLQLPGGREEEGGGLALPDRSAAFPRLRQMGSSQCAQGLHAE